MDTKRSLYEIEVALAKHQAFNYLKNIVAYNVTGISEILPLFHECDMLVLSKSGYLTEIEIKRSYQDFLNDFKKKHNHPTNGLIKYFYFCVPKSIKDKVYDFLYEKKEYRYSGIITYDEDLNIEISGAKRENWIKSDDEKYVYAIKEMIGHRKLFIEQQLEVARLASMRVIKLKEKLIENKKSDYVDSKNKTF